MVVVAVRVSFSIALEHDGKKPYQCSICDDTFTGPGTDYSHQLTQLSRFEFELESTRRQHHLKNHYSSIYTYQSKVHQKINQLRVPIKKSHGIKCRSDIEHSEIDNIISFEISAYTLNSLIPHMTFLKGPVLVRQDRSVKYCWSGPVRKDLNLVGPFYHYYLLLHFSSDLNTKHVYELGMTRRRF